MKSKYNLNDIVWFMYDNKPIEGSINGISFIVSNNLCSWKNQELYCIQTTKKQENYMKEEHIFESKNDLIQFLTS